MLSVLMPLATSDDVGAPESGVAYDHPFEPIIFGVITLGIFLGLLAVLWMFRNTLALPAHRHDARQGQHGHPGEPGDHGQVDDATRASSSPTS